MINKIEDFYAAIEEYGPLKLAVAAGEDTDVLQAVRAAQDRGIIQAVIAGNKERMKEIAVKAGFHLEGMELLHAEDAKESVALAMEQVRDGKADLVMKGNVATADFLRGVLDKEYGQRIGRILSHIVVIEVDGFSRLIFVTDGAVNIAPDLDKKQGILENAVSLAHYMGNPRPNVGVICAVEKVSEKMPATTDARQLVERAEKGEIQGCNISGPFALDNALSEHSAQIKGIRDPYAGKSDILLMPDIEAGNILFKALVYLAPSKTAGVVMGARIPVVLTSRSDSFETKLNSIAAAVYLAHAKRK